MIRRHHAPMPKRPLAVAGLAAVLALAGCNELRGTHAFRVGERIDATHAPAIGSAAARTVGWGELLPAGWNPADIPGAEQAKGLDDRDPRARALLREMRERGRNAPVNGALDGVEVRIAGFAVPLDYSRGRITEFLLVPSFGACIHAPPPPANQVIHVLAASPVEKGTMSVAWVSGRLRAAPGDTAMARSGYRIEGAQVKFVAR
jgi:hypothetical protein